MDKEELLGGLIALVCIGLVALVICACREADKEYEMLLRKYPECITAGHPGLCTQYKQMMEE